jgi:predicted RNase H-like HicB family nuclease
MVVGAADPPGDRGGSGMKKRDQYHQWVEWSEEDGVYIGKFPDLITGIHGDDPKKVYADQCEVIEDVIAHFEAEGRSLPPPKVRPMQEVL